MHNDENNDILSLCIFPYKIEFIKQNLTNAMNKLIFWPKFPISSW